MARGMGKSWVRLRPLSSTSLAGDSKGDCGESNIWELWIDDDIQYCEPFPPPFVLALSSNPFSQLDYSAGVLPVTTVQPTLDALPPAAEFARTPEYARMGTLARDVYGLYDAQKMEGLPVGVQVIGRRFEEEAVLAGMRAVEEALAADGNVFNGGKNF